MPVPAELSNLPEMSFFLDLNGANIFGDLIKGKNPVDAFHQAYAEHCKFKWEDKECHFRDFMKGKDKNAVDKIIKELSDNGLIDKGFIEFIKEKEKEVIKDGKIEKEKIPNKNFLLFLPYLQNEINKLEKIHERNPDNEERLQKYKEFLGEFNKRLEKNTGINLINSDSQTMDLSPFVKFDATNALHKAIQDPLSEFFVSARNLISKYRNQNVAFIYRTFGIDGLYLREKLQQFILAEKIKEMEDKAEAAMNRDVADEKDSKIDHVNVPFLGFPDNAQAKDNNVEFDADLPEQKHVDDVIRRIITGGYDLVLTPDVKESKQDLKKLCIEFEVQNDGIEYRVKGLNNEEIRDKILWDKLPDDFPRDSAKILENKDQWLLPILNETKARGHTEPSHVQVWMDHYPIWKASGPTHAGGKPYYIDLESDNLFMFFDDNVSDQKIIRVTVRGLDVETLGAKLENEMQVKLQGLLIAMGWLVNVSTWEAATNEHYYEEKVARVLTDAYRDHLTHSDYMADCRNRIKEVLAPYEKIIEAKIKLLTETKLEPGAPSLFEHRSQSAAIHASAPASAAAAPLETPANTTPTVIPSGSTPKH